MHRFVVLLAPLVLIAACDAPTVQWTDPVAFAGAPGQRLSLGASGVPVAVADPAPADVALPPGANICKSSLRTARGSGSLHGAWWVVRSDSSAGLYASTSTDSGRSWSPAVPVDTADRGIAGCSRPAPALATVGDDLQLAYSLAAPEGTGVFFAHFMGSMLHSPVAVIYGERLVATAIAAEGDRVAVAYEEPNGKRAQVDVAFSSSQGHIFEWHETASRGVDVATSPAVALSGNEIAVAWSTRQPADTIASRVVRTGHFR
ncbi:MAG: hypothetical protein ABI442_15445 [Gemmatimonadaceae bacterium]